MNEISKLLPKGLTLTPVGLPDLPVNLSFDEWKQIGRYLGKLQGATNWAIADWWNSGEHQYGERKAIVESEDWDGPCHEVCMNIASMGKKFKTSRRREVLPFSFHQEVAALPPAEADELLDWAEKPNGQGKRPTQKALREEVRRRKAIRAPEWFTVEAWSKLGSKQKEAIIPEKTNKVFNKQDGPAIEWAQWSWNPVTGCKHDCSYCYARDIANRFYEHKFEPVIHPNRLNIPQSMRAPERAVYDVSLKNVFTCSMADLFGRWVPREWIELVFESVRKSPQWNFLFLTKFPKRMAELDWPTNAWLGTSVDCQKRVKAAESAFSQISGGTKWLSIEPMLTPLQFERLDLFDWIVIGGASASTQTPEWRPPMDWLVDLHLQAREAGCKIYYKDNSGLTGTTRIREFPWIESETPVPGTEFGRL